MLAERFGVSGTVAAGSMAMEALRGRQLWVSFVVERCYWSDEKSQVPAVREPGLLCLLLLAE